MNWLFELHQTPPIAHAVGVLAFVRVLGMALGSLKWRGIGLAVDNLIRRSVNILFTIGGDGTQRGGNELFQEANKRGPGRDRPTGTIRVTAQNL